MRTLVDRLKGGHVWVCCVNGDEHEYPTVEICVKVQYQTYRLKAGIVKGVERRIVCQERKQCSQLEVRYGKEGGGGPSDAELTCGTWWIG